MPDDPRTQPEAEPTFAAVVIGGSAGGMEALTVILPRLPVGFRLPVLVVQHLHPTDGGYFAEHLDRIAALPASEARDKERVVGGHVYTAPAGYHLLVERDETLALSVDEKVNWARPSIDVLFDSAARAWGRRLIAVILSGANDDGAAGMRLIARYGGFTIAQDPETAPHPVMPRAALAATAIHRVLPPATIVDVLIELSAPRRIEGDGPTMEQHWGGPS